jgi:hypothetical protein
MLWTPTTHSVADITSGVGLQTWDSFSDTHSRIWVLPHPLGPTMTEKAFKPLAKCRAVSTAPTFDGKTASDPKVLADPRKRISESVGCWTLVIGLLSDTIDTYSPWQLSSVRLLKSYT